MNEPQTVRVRIAVAVTEDGAWTAFGGDIFPASEVFDRVASDFSSDRNVSLFWVDADVPLPLAPQTVKGVVSDDA